ncbi:MAG TPA: hypothetical protein VEN29_21085 [Casimicrobiaceae bacterium]|nr:hypothetical protein [Casimicrobiaceae bacterium]
MTPRTEPRAGGKRWAGLLLALALLSPHSPAATTTIYKCFDQNLGLVYTDEPCKDGEKLDIRAGDADPTAVARLERERDALDLSAAQRIADERRIAAQRDLAAWMTYPGGEDYAGGFPAYDYGWMWWYPAFAHAHPPRMPFPRAAGPRRFIPNPPPLPRQL